LVLRAGALGDFILTVPVLTGLRSAYPDATLTLVAGAANTRLAIAAGLVDHAIAMESARAAALFHHGATLDALEEFADADAAAVLLSDPDGSVRANLKRLSAAPIAHKDPAGLVGHAADYLADVLTQFGVSAARPAIPRMTIPTCRPSPDALQVILHPGSGSPRKNWPPASFRELADRLHAARPDVHIVFTFGEADDQLKDGPDLPGPYACVHETDIVDMATVLASARAYVGNDSGVTHLAAALGTRVTALFGPTDPSTWGPRGRRCRILQPHPDAVGSLTELPVDAVLQSVLQDVD
jgi:ADP-heptose:LPS heptosyltransferase